MGVARYAILLILVLSTLAFSQCEGRGDPFAAKASLLRFWHRTLPDARLPSFLLEKASPLNATSVALFYHYLRNHTLSDNIASFCTAAHLLCPATTVGNDEDFDIPTFKNYGEKPVPTPPQATSIDMPTFKNYGKKPVPTPPRATSINMPTFKNYGKKPVPTPPRATSISPGVEAGMFFRENLLVQGKTLPMPDLKDYMPTRSFLPASLADKLPFSSETLPNLMKTFGIPDNSTMSSIMARTLHECQSAAAKGEIKKCVTSVEGMAEFAVLVLGSKVEVLSTETTAGSRESVEVGVVRGKDGGKVTRSVSCHQSLFPFLVYYCHSVPMVKVYEAALLSNKDKEKKKINEGIAICHSDTTQWSANHAAFVSLGHKPGEIEVCHWIFENDLLWVPLPA